MRNILIGAVAAAGLSAAAHGQLLVGWDEVGATHAWNVDVGDGSSTALWSNFEVWGMAYDPDTATVYANDGSTLGAGPASAAFPSSTVGVTDNLGNSLSLVGLAWAQGALYASRNIANEAIYKVNTVTGVAEVAFDYTDGDYDFGGLAYNTADGLFYGTNDDATPASGLYSIDVFGAGGINLVAAYPAGRTDIDGLAIGEGIAYLVEDEAGDTIHRYDLINDVYLSPLTSPMNDSAVFSGAAYITSVPSPGALALLGLAGLGFTRRRR